MDRKDGYGAGPQPDAQATYDRFYRAFEERFRGPRETIRSRLCVYLEFIEPLKSIYDRPVAVDVGCGRGEWLELLAENGFDANGVDLDEGMLAACYENGLRATKEDGIAFLAKLPNESQVIVSGFHIAEHLPFAQLQMLMQQAWRVLKPGGLLILETPNPENFRVSSLTFYYDPTHRHPLPPELLSFLTEYYGFNRVKVIRLQECPGLLTSQATSLDQVLGGAGLDYAVIAQKAADGSVALLFDSAFNKEFGLDARVLVGRFDRQLVAQNEHVTALAGRLDEERTARAALEAHLLAKNEAIVALYGSKSWRITAPLRSTRRMARWFVHGTWAWVTLKPGSRPGRVATSCLVGVVRFYHAARPSLENMARQTLRWLPAVKTRLQRIILSDTFRPGAVPATDEFRQQNPGILPGVTGRFLDETDCEIETDATPEQLEAMLLRIKAAWQSFGETEPHYSVLTHEAYRPNNINKNLDTFYARGLDEVNRVLAFLSRNHIDLSNIRRVLDYGCGVGRLTLPLARKFPAVLGVDVSEKHIEQARRYAAERRVRNIDFAKIADLEELNYLSDVDFILSLIVLQHNPPPVIAAILRKLLNTLNSGGCAIFQVPTYYQGFRFFCSDYLSKPSPQMEMNAIPQRAVYAIARDSGCDILEIREDNLTGSPLMLSHVFLVQKRGSAH